MAQSNVLAPIFYSAIGGLSDDIFSGIDGSFVESKNINIRDNAKGISLNNALISNSGAEIVEPINVFLKTSTGVMMAFGSNGGIYYKPTTTWVKITTDNPASSILSADEFNGYIYWTNATQLNRLAVGDLDADISADDAINRQALNNSSYHPILVSQGDMYVGNKGDMGKVNISDVREDLVTMDSNGTITDLDDLGGSIRIVSRAGIGKTRIYLWDGVSDTPDQNIPLRGYDVKHSIIHNGYNYLVTNKGLGILDGYKVYPVKKKDVFDSNLHTIDVFNEKLYIGGTGGVYVWGSKSKDYPEVLNKAYSTSNGQDDDEITAIYNDGERLYVAWRNGSTYGIDRLSDSVYYATGYLITKGYYANSLKEIKETIGGAIAYSELATGEEVKISYALDGGSYTEIIDIDSSTVTLDGFTEDLLFSSEAFQYIQFKIELTGPTTTTPFFYILDMLFNNNLQR